MYSKISGKKVRVPPFGYALNFTLIGGEILVKIKRAIAMSVFTDVIISVFARTDYIAVFGAIGPSVAAGTEVITVGIEVGGEAVHQRVPK